MLAREFLRVLKLVKKKARGGFFLLIILGGCGSILMDTISHFLCEESRLPTLADALILRVKR
jgi:uncharacterized membrane protein YeaQ/YmgE (transglycosylase-associated protein family)